jgi:intergrase/recombinase
VEIIIEYNIKEVTMNVKKEFDEITESLKQQRGDIQLQIHLANMEAKQEWKKAEKNWDKFVDSIGVITDETKETSTEIIHATKVIGDELKDAYGRISERLKQ